MRRQPFSNSCNMSKSADTVQLFLNMFLTKNTFCKKKPLYFTNDGRLASLYNWERRRMLQDRADSSDQNPHCLRSVVCSLEVARKALKKHQKNSAKSSQAQKSKGSMQDSLSIKTISSNYAKFINYRAISNAPSVENALETLKKNHKDIENFQKNRFIKQ